MSSIGSFTVLRSRDQAHGAIGKCTVSSLQCLLLAYYNAISIALYLTFSRNYELKLLFHLQKLHFLVALVIISWLLLCGAQVYYVSPTLPLNSACPSDKPCHTLSYYAANTSIFSNSNNVSLLFLDGHYNLSNNFQLNLSLFNQSFTLAAVNLTEDISVSLSSVSIYFGTLSLVKLAGISLNNSRLYIYQASDVKFHQVFASNVEIMIMNNFDSLELDKSELTNSVWEIAPTINTGNQLAFEVSKTQLTDMEIFFSFYSLSSIKFNNIAFDNSSLSMEFFGASLNSHILEFSSCDFASSSKRISLFYHAAVNLTITGCHFKEELRFQYDPPGENNAIIMITHSQFEQSALYFDYQPQSSFNNNLLLTNVSMFDMKQALVVYGPTNLTVEDCYFANNSGLLSPVLLDQVDLNFRGNTTFINNIGSAGGALHLSRSRILLDTCLNTTVANFTGNFATQVGGAIFVESCGLQITDTVISDAERVTQCFYQLVQDILVPPCFNRPQISFESNTGKLGGDNIYGAGLLSNCTVSRFSHSFDTQSSIFKFKTPSLSSVSSNPRRICLCENGLPQCAHIDQIYYNVSVNPGEIFDLSVFVVGEDFGPVTGSVYALPVKINQNFSFPVEQVLQQVTTQTECTRLQYSVNPSIETKRLSFVLSTVSLTASFHQAGINTTFNYSSIEKLIAVYREKHDTLILPDLLYAPVVVSVSLLPCPLGFELNADNVCACARQLNDEFVCEVQNRTGVFFRSGTNWIGLVGDNATIGYHNLCPFGYCNKKREGVDLYDCDTQCDMHHSGVLCGGCPPGLSLAIGSSNCIRCEDNSHVALLLVFILAGVVLVIFIKMLDMTVSHGTINGLIFYANVIWINRSEYFANIDGQFIPGFLKGFIAWLNLDFGIETCFIQGLNAYWNTWLQFVFPLYVMSLAVLIIIVCKYSTRVTRLFGNNAVSVLATLILLSYVKLLRTIVSIFGFAILKIYPSGTKIVWLADGNVSYFNVQHAFLFIAGLGLLFFMWFPYSTLLLFTHRLSSRFRWLNSLTPFLDTYTGPLKPKHQYWVGFTLFARVLLAVITGALQAVNPIISINFIALTCALCLALAVKVYKSVWISILEVIFQFNIITLCVIYLSTEDAKTRIVVTSISAGITFLMFVGILLYHAISPLWKRYHHSSRQSYQTLELPSINTDQDSNGDFVTKTVINLREDLLEDDT